MRAVTTRVRGLAAWTPRRATRELLDLVQSVLVEYAAYMPLTVRQIFYRLVGAHGHGKTEQAYSELGEHLNRARRAGLIELSAIRDDGVTFKEPLAWDSPRELVESFLHHANRFLDRQVGQTGRLIFAVEAAGMVPQVERITAPFGIAIHSSGGCHSLTAEHDLAERLCECEAVEVLHIGDHDPSGTHLFTSMPEDIERIADDLGLEGDMEFTRLAVTPEQIRKLGLPTAPPKPTDERRFSGETVQCEPIPPDELARIIRAAIDERIDQSAYGEVQQQEEKTASLRLKEQHGSLLDSGSRTS